MRDSRPGAPCYVPPAAADTEDDGCLSGCRVCTRRGPHHRHAAAVRKGLPQVPCWVVDMDDDEAFMELVKSNAQGELSPLERGMHFKQSGLGSTAYAKLVGNVTAAQITYDGKAAEVYEAVLTQVKAEVAAELRRNRNKHLYEIGIAAPRWLWPALVAELVAKSWTVEVARGKVKALGQDVLQHERAAAETMVETQPK